MALSALVSAFVVKRKRHRYLGLLKSSRGTMKLRGDLAHFPDFDPRFIIEIEPKLQTVDGIERLLLDLGSPQQCAVFSESEALDVSGARLKDALEKVLAVGYGSIVLCRPGTLAYYESEEPGVRFILHRRPPT